MILRDGSAPEGCVGLRTIEELASAGRWCTVKAAGGVTSRVGRWYGVTSAVSGSYETLG